MGKDRRQLATLTLALPDITLAELLWTLDKGRGADMVGYPLLQRLPLAVKMTLLAKCYNRLHPEAKLPRFWTSVIYS